MLILTALTSQGGFGRQIYRNFAGSLDATGFKGDVVFLTTLREIAASKLSTLQDEIDCLKFSPIPGPGDNRDINCYRYRHYYDYLRSRSGDYDYVMLSDSRDVIFQRDISKYPFHPETDLFLAEEEKLIGECGINSGWIFDLYGENWRQALKNKTVLCSGTTIGRPPAMLQYLEIMLEHIERVDEEFHERFGYLGGIDQGIHNYLYHANKLTGLSVKTMHNQDNLFYTIGHVAHDDRDRVFLDEQSKFINQDGKLCYCIHQFDRLDEHIRRAFNQNSPFSV